MKLRKEPRVVAIDGPTKSGKSAVSKIVAEILGYHLLPSGALYRGVALKAERLGVADTDICGLMAIAQNLRMSFKNNRIFLDGADETEVIESARIGALTPRIADKTVVREAILQFQRCMRKPPGLVAEGRDMGFIFETPYRFWLHVTPKIRAQRMVNHALIWRYEVLDCDQAQQGIEARDRADMIRLVSPLTIHPHAERIDANVWTAQEIASYIVEYCATH